MTRDAPGAAQRSNLSAQWFAYDSQFVGEDDVTCAGCRWKEEQVNAELKIKMDEAFGDLWRKSLKDEIPLRTASFALALERVVRATVNRGFS
jgi:Glutamate/Leucine/Phenylalanine/Valine dehydrogenase